MSTIEIDGTLNTPLTRRNTDAVEYEQIFSHMCYSHHNIPQASSNAEHTLVHVNAADNG